MIQNILKQIDNINQAISWVKKYHPSEYNVRFLQLVEERRKLNILVNAERNNPGVAAFGQSQVGKSYLMNCILQDGNKPFMVESPEGEKNFVDSINPIGDGQEATGVMTRFSSYKRNPGDYEKNMPIRFRALNVRDVVLVICDTYFNDFSDFTTYGELELNSKLEELTEKYSSMPEQSKTVMKADDLLEMKLYFSHYIKNPQIFTIRTAFFDRLALIIDKIPVSDYSSIFSLLWHNEGEFTKLFTKCIDILQRIRFAEYVYLPIGAVVHGGVKEDTIMSVSCLKLLFDEKSRNYMTEAYQRTDAGLEKLGDFTKSELCTICSEVVIRISERFLSSTGRYDMRNITMENQGKLPSGEVPMTLLNDTDLLDFPGARARENGQMEKTKNPETLIYSFLRGKIAYLFNKYNEEKAINILLHCHHQGNMDATQMWGLLRDWVNAYVGNTPEKRASLISQTQVAPLFHIGTMFNKDLQDPSNRTEGYTEKSILARWNSRFDELLAASCFHRQDVEWVNNWDGNGRPFQNCYMLRDFNFSKQVYSGFETTGKEQDLVISQSYYNDLRAMFIESNNEKHHMFRDPSLAWDASASIGNDGALFIIQQVSIAASNIQKARESQIENTLEEVCRTCLNIMKEYFISTDTEEILDANVAKANGIFRDLEFTCQNNPEYFGHLIQALQLTESETFKELHRIIPTLTSTVTGDTDIIDYELIRKRCDYFKDCTNESQKWDLLIERYRFKNKEEAQKYLENKNIKPEKLFGNSQIKRKNSSVITTNLMNLWRNNIQSVQFMNSFAGRDMVDEIVITNLVSCIVNTSDSVMLGGTIESMIADYVDVLNTSNINEDLIADIVATCISDFVTDFGYSYLSDEQISTSKRIAKEMNLPCFDWIERDRKETYSEDEMTNLFNGILSTTERFTPAYEANYNSWLEYMYIAYIAHINVPEYDREANDKLKLILDDLRTV